MPGAADGRYCGVCAKGSPLLMILARFRQSRTSQRISSIQTRLPKLGLNKRQKPFGHIINTNAIIATPFKQSDAVVPNPKTEKHNDANNYLPTRKYRRLLWDDPRSTQANAPKTVAPTRKPLIKLVRWPLFEQTATRKHAKQNTSKNNTVLLLRQLCTHFLLQPHLRSSDLTNCGKASQIFDKVS